MAEITLVIVTTLVLGEIVFTVSKRIYFQTPRSRNMTFLIILPSIVPQTRKKMKLYY